MAEFLEFGRFLFELVGVFEGLDFLGQGGERLHGLVMIGGEGGGFFSELDGLGVDGGGVEVLDEGLFGTDLMAEVS